MTRVLGVDPGTRSFDFCGLEEGEVFMDETIPSKEIGENPKVFIDVLKSAEPVDLVTGPSGYGLPLSHISQVEMPEDFLLILVRPGDLKISVLVGIRKIVKMLRKERFNLYFMPGVIQLPTVPKHRKINKIDMGTADKLCCAALGIFDQARRLGIGYEETSFILVELGYGYNAFLGVEGGKILDGIGGTMGGLGFLTLGGMDSELAYLLDGFSKDLLFRGGVTSIVGQEDLTPEEFAERATSNDKFGLAWEALMEGIEKGVASMNVSIREPREILVSGRLSRVQGIYEEVDERLSSFGRVRRVEGFAKVSKEAAQGAALIADGLAGGRYRELVDSMRIREAEGTVLDHICVVEAEEIKKRYGIA